MEGVGTEDAQEAEVFSAVTAEAVGHTPTECAWGRGSGRTHQGSQKAGQPSQDSDSVTSHRKETKSKGVQSQQNRELELRESPAAA